MSGSKKFGYILLALAVFVLAFGLVQWSALMESLTQILIKGDLKGDAADLWLYSVKGMLPLLVIMSALGGLVFVAAVSFICGDFQIVDRKARPEGRADVAGGTDS